MKKGFYAILAILTVFALTMVSCGDSGGGSKSPTTTKVTFNFNIPEEDGEALFEVDELETNPITLKKGDAIGTLPVIADTDENFYFMGWYTKKLDVDALGDEDFVLTGEKVTEAYTTTADAVTLYAYWEAYKPQAVTFNMNGGWNAAGTEEGGTIIVQVHKGTPVGAKMPGNPFKNGNTFTGWFTAATAGTAFTGDIIITAPITVYAQFAPETIVPSKDTTAGEEWVLLNNGFYVVYKFTLSAGATWDDYNVLSVEYNVPVKIDSEPELSEMVEGVKQDRDWWTVPNGARGLRLMGNYKSTDFSLITTETTPAKTLAIASYNDGKNAPYIIDDNIIAWKSVAAAVGSGTGALNLTPEPSAGEWWTTEYKIDASRPNSAFLSSNKPHPKASGPFFFGVGISAQNDYGTPQQIRNVTLKAKSTSSGVSDVIATPAIFVVDGIEYPAFTGYPDTSGGNGVAEAYRGDTRPVFETGEPAGPKATADLLVVSSTPVVNTVAFDKRYDDVHGVKIKVTFPTVPAGINLSSYEYYTIRLETSVDGVTFTPVTADDVAQVDFLPEDGPRLGVQYNAGTNSTIKGTVLPGVLAKASQFDSFLIYNSAIFSDTSIRYIKVVEVTLHAYTGKGKAVFSITDETLKDPLSGIANQNLALSTDGLAITAPSLSGATYLWKLDGVEQTETGNTFTLAASGYLNSIGNKYTVSLVVKHESKNYSQTIIVTVTK